MPERDKSFSMAALRGCFVHRDQPHLADVQLGHRFPDIVWNTRHSRVSCIRISRAAALTGISAISRIAHASNRYVKCERTLSPPGAMDN